MRKTHSPSHQKTVGKPYKIEKPSSLLDFGLLMGVGKPTG